MEQLREKPKSDRGWQTYLANLRAPRKREWLGLGGCLDVCLLPDGTKIFQARLRRRGDRSASRIEVGSFPAVSVAEARKKILEMRSVIREGRDPALERRRARAGIRAVRTLADLVNEYLGRREGAIAPKTLKLETELLEGVLAPALGRRLLSDLEPRDFGLVLSDYSNRLRREKRSDGTNANKLLAVTRRVFKSARGWGLIDMTDPTVGLIRPAKERPRDRILFDGHVLVGPNPKVNELGKLAAALTGDTELGPDNLSTRVALMLTLMLGLRALEVSSLEWDAIDLDGDLPSVTVTTSKTKAGLRELPLPGAAVALLRALKPTGARKPRCVFPAEEGAVRTQHLHPESLSRAFARACDRLGIKSATLHDLRRTCLSGLIELGHEIGRRPHRRPRAQACPRAPL